MADGNSEPQEPDNTTGAQQEPTIEDLQRQLAESKAHSREWEKRAKANKNAADELEALKESTLSETEKANKRAEKAEAELAAFKSEQQKADWRTSASEQYGVPAELLHGDTEDAIAESAKALKTWGDSLKPKSYAPKIADPAGHPSNNTNDINAGLLKQLFGNN